MMFVYAKRGANARGNENVSEKFSFYHSWVSLSGIYLPSPIAAQQRTVTIDNVTFKLVIE